MPLMSIRAYARHRAVSQTAVQKAITQGRISKSADGKIDSDDADRKWSRNTGPSKNAECQPVKSRAPAAEPVESKQPEASGFALWREQREQWQAKIAEQDFLKRAGELVDREQVRLAAFSKGRLVRDALLSIPDRVSSLLTSQTDTAQVHKILTDEITAAIRELSRDTAAAG